MTEGMSEEVQPEREASTPTDPEKAHSERMTEPLLASTLTLDSSLECRSGSSTICLAGTRSSLSRKVVSEYFDLLEGRLPESGEVVAIRTKHERLLKLVDDYPELLMKVSPKYRWTILHDAVLRNSEIMIKKVLMIVCEELRDFMAATDGDHDGSKLEKSLKFFFAVDNRHCKLNALEIAAIPGNKKILKVLNSAHSALLDLKMGYHNSDHLRSWWESDSKSAEELTEGSLEEHQGHLKQIREVFESFPDLNPGNILERKAPKTMSHGMEFSLHSFFDVLKEEKAEPWESIGTDLSELLPSIISKLAEESSSLLPTLLQLQDHGGRTLLHCLAELDDGDYEDDDELVYIFNSMMKTLKEHVPKLDMNVRDFVGRTPLHWAAALDRPRRVKYFADDKRTDVNATSDKMEVWVDENQEIITVEGMTALQLAVTHNRYLVVEALLESPRDRTNSEPLDVNHIFDIRSKIEDEFEFFYWSPLQLAAWKGHVQTIQALLKDDRVYDAGFIVQKPKLTPQESRKKSLIFSCPIFWQQHEQGQEKERDDDEEVPSTIPALHLAAESGKPLAINAFLSCERVDPFAVDEDGDTALHYATGQWDRAPLYEYAPWEFVSFDNLHSNPHRIRRVKTINFAGFFGCIELLLQAGLDMNQPNYAGANPYFHQHVPDEVQRWWFERMAKQTQDTKNNIIVATTAISVTGALVATTSFVGPLQPPLGLSTNANSEHMWLLGYSQVNHSAVDVFIFCDNMSFYLAIASIMLALIPALPAPNEGLSFQVKKDQKSLQGAVVLLFVSIAFVICAFGAANVAIIPEGRWKYQASIIFTTFLGGSTCFFVLLLFFQRLWRLIRPKTRM